MVVLRFLGVCSWWWLGWVVLRQGSAGGLVACGVVLPPSTLTENVTQVCFVGLARCFAGFVIEL